MRYLVTGYEPDRDEAVSSYELPAPEEAYLCRLVGVDDVDQLVAADHELDDDKLAELVGRFGLALVAEPQEYFLEAYGDDVDLDL